MQFSPLSVRISSGYQAVLGAIAGDICGSPWEGGQCADVEFQLFAHGASITDDSVCTVAVAEVLLAGGGSGAVARALRAWCKRYPGLGYGSAFNHWVYSQKGPYNSYGNGGAMRVSACGWLADSLEAAESFADMTAGVTHNHPEGLRGARAIAGAIWWARQGLSGDELRARLAARYGYLLNRSLAELREEALYSTEARDTVPVALMCATYARTWEEAIRFAATIGGDTDTIAAMAGAVAEARFGLPEQVVNTYSTYVPEDMRTVLHTFYERIGGVRLESAAIDLVAPKREPRLIARLMRLFGR